LGRKYLREKKAHGAPEGNRNAEKQSGQSDHFEKTASTIATAHGASEKTVRRAAEFPKAVAFMVDAGNASVL